MVVDEVGIHIHQCRSQRLDCDILKMLAKTLLFISLYASLAAAVCPGFNYAVGNVQSLGNGVNRCLLYYACTIGYMAC